MAPYAEVRPQSMTPQADGMSPDPHTHPAAQAAQDHRVARVCALLAPLACSSAARPALAQTVQQDALIQVLFGELPPTKILTPTTMAL